MMTETFAEVILRLLASASPKDFLAQAVDWLWWILWRLAPSLFEEDVEEYFSHRALEGQSDGLDNDELLDSDAVETVFFTAHSFVQVLVAVWFLTIAVLGVRYKETLRFYFTGKRLKKSDSKATRRASTGSNGSSTLLGASSSSGSLESRQSGKTPQQRGSSLSSDAGGGRSGTPKMKMRQVKVRVSVGEGGPQLAAGTPAGRGSTWRFADGVGGSSASLAAQSTDFGESTFGLGEGSASALRRSRLLECSPSPQVSTRFLEGTSELRAKAQRSQILSGRSPEPAVRRMLDYPHAAQSAGRESRCDPPLALAASGRTSSGFLLSAQANGSGCGTGSAPGRHSQVLNTSSDDIRQKLLERHEELPATVDSLPTPPQAQAAAAAGFLSPSAQLPRAGNRPIFQLIQMPLPPPDKKATKKKGAGGKRAKPKEGKKRALERDEDEIEEANPQLVPPEIRQQQRQQEGTSQNGTVVPSARGQQTGVGGGEQLHEVQSYGQSTSSPAGRKRERGDEALLADGESSLYVPMDPTNRTREIIRLGVLDLQRQQAARHSQGSEGRQSAGHTNGTTAAASLGGMKRQRSLTVYDETDDTRSIAALRAKLMSSLGQVASGPRRSPGAQNGFDDLAHGNISLLSFTWATAEGEEERAPPPSGANNEREELLIDGDEVPPPPNYSRLAPPTAKDTGALQEPQQSTLSDFGAGPTAVFVEEQKGDGVVASEEKKKTEPLPNANAGTSPVSSLFGLQPAATTEQGPSAARSPFSFGIGGAVSTETKPLVPPATTGATAPAPFMGAPVPDAPPVSSASAVTVPCPATSTGTGSTTTGPLMRKDESDSVSPAVAPPPIPPVHSVLNVQHLHKGDLTVHPHFAEPAPKEVKAPSSVSFSFGPSTDAAQQKRSKSPDFTPSLPKMSPKVAPLGPVDVVVDVVQASPLSPFSPPLGSTATIDGPATAPPPPPPEEKKEEHHGHPMPEYDGSHVEPPAHSALNLRHIHRGDSSVHAHFSLMSEGSNKEKEKQQPFGDKATSSSSEAAGGIAEKNPFVSIEGPTAVRGSTSAATGPPPSGLSPFSAPPPTAPTAPSPFAAAGAAQVSQPPQSSPFGASTSGTSTAVVSTGTGPSATTAAAPWVQRKDKSAPSPFDQPKKSVLEPPAAAAITAAPTSTAQSSVPSTGSGASPFDAPKSFAPKSAPFSSAAKDSAFEKQNDAPPPPVTSPPPPFGLPGKGKAPVNVAEVKENKKGFAFENDKRTPGVPGTAGGSGSPFGSRPSGGDSSVLATTGKPATSSAFTNGGKSNAGGPVPQTAVGNERLSSGSGTGFAGGSGGFGAQAPSSGPVAPFSQAASADTGAQRQPQAGGPTAFDRGSPRFSGPGGAGPSKGPPALPQERKGLPSDSFDGRKSGSPFGAPPQQPQAQPPMQPRTAPPPPAFGVPTSQGAVTSFPAPPPPPSHQQPPAKTTAPPGTSTGFAGAPTGFGSPSGPTHQPEQQTTKTFGQRPEPPKSHRRVKK